MIQHDCTANTADLKNTPTLYPVIASSNLLHINEDDEDYDTTPKTDKAMQLSCKKLKAYLEQRLNLEKSVGNRMITVTTDKQ